MTLRGNPNFRRLRAWAGTRPPASRGFRRWPPSWRTVTESLLPDGPGLVNSAKLLSGGGRGRGGMVHYAGRRCSCCLARASSFFDGPTRRADCCLAGSEAPKLAKAPTSHPTTTSEEKASPPPQALIIGRGGSPESSRGRGDRAISASKSAAGVKQRKYSRRYEPRRERARPTQTNLPTMLRERPEVVRLKYRPTSRAQPAKVLRRCNPKCHREARRRRAT